MSRILKVAGFALLSALIVSGCVQLGPDYQEPAVVVETDWLEIDKQHFSTEPAVGPRWWETTFNDPELNWLVDSALQELNLANAVVADAKDAYLAAGVQCVKGPSHLFRLDQTADGDLGNYLFQGLLIHSL